MPTIELVAIDCPEIPGLPIYAGIDYICEKELLSHRALFQPVFKSLGGVIFHLAEKGPDASKRGFWFGGMLVVWKPRHALVFRSEVLEDVMDLMRRLLDASPRHRITFSTDYQFGGRMRIQGEISFAGFWDLHDQGKLRYNHLWWIVADEDAGC
ncbi:MAG: hypothetical protein QM755_15290 [Luteolibacter sp.]